jgi:hypothetical protein
VRRIYECASDLTPTEFLLILAIGVGVTTPIIGKISAICFSLFLSKKFDVSGRRGDEIENSKAKGASESSLLGEGVGNK